MLIIFFFWSFQCSLVAGRLTSGLPSITFLVSGGAVIQAVVFIWLLLGQRLATLENLLHLELFCNEYHEGRVY